ncbi:MAG: hypothetical protein WCF18_12900 [Chthoniobacteraceae bacterium]
MRVRLFFGAANGKTAAMKFNVSPIFSLAVAMLALGINARAEVSPYRLRVEQVSKSENEKFTKKQHRSLKIFVSNSSKEAAELLAKYVFFGRQAKENDVVKIDEGEKAVSVGPLATQMVESGIATATFEEEHSSGGYSKGSKSSAKKVEATGSKIIGFGVRLYKGETMVAEYYDPPSGKEEWEKAYPVKLPAAPKK